MPPNLLTTAYGQASGAFTGDADYINVSYDVSTPAGRGNLLVVAAVAISCDGSGGGTINPGGMYLDGTNFTFFTGRRTGGYNSYNSLLGWPGVTPGGPGTRSFSADAVPFPGGPYPFNAWIDTAVALFDMGDPTPSDFYGEAYKSSGGSPFQASVSSILNQMVFSACVSRNASAPTVGAGDTLIKSYAGGAVKDSFGFSYRLATEASTTMGWSGAVTDPYSVIVASVNVLPDGGFMPFFS